MTAGISGGVGPGRMLGVVRQRRRHARSAPSPRRVRAFGTRWRQVESVTVVLGCLLAAGVALTLTSLTGADVRRIGSYGLVSALPLGAIGGLAIMAASFFAALAVRRPSSALLLANVVALAATLAAAPYLVEGVARFGTAYTHAGFVEAIQRTGHTFPGIDARFSWPGFFAAAAMALAAAGATDPRTLLAWAPVVVDLLFIAPLWMILRALVPDVRVRWLALWLFFVANWVGQDYFAPQAFGYLAYLTVLAVLLTWFRPRVATPMPAWLGRADRALSGGRPEPAPPSAELHGRVGAGLSAAVLVLVAATVVSHQLTPFMLLIAVSALVATGRCSLRGLPVLVAVGTAAWISYAAVAFWSGHLDDLFGSIGRVGSTVSTSVSARIVGTQAHRNVLLLRLALAAALWGLAALGAWRLRRSGHGVTTLVLLALAPFPVLALQSYGGEVLLRVYLFALPAVAALAAYAVAPRKTQDGARVTSAALLGSVLLATFWVARYGNEQFESTRPGELAAVDWVYAHAPLGASLFALTNNVPWRYRSLERYDYVTSTDPLVDAATLAGRMRDAGPSSLLVITASQVADAQISYGQPADFAARAVARLDASGDLRLVYSNRDARVYALNSTGER